MDQALRRIPHEAWRGAELTVYRGWMLRSPEYARLVEALSGKKVRLVNDSDAYRYCHELPAWYADFKDITPESAVVPWTGRLDLAAVREALRVFGEAPLVLKDFVKSQKHYWKEACFIPNASDLEGVERVTRRFLELQAETLEGGLVYRRYIELQPIGMHPRSGMPLTLEFRLFFFDGRLLQALPYWETGTYGNSAPPLERFNSIAARVKSRFFTMDVAKARTGEWLLIELGDGQVAGLPDHANLDSFYSRMAMLLESETLRPFNHACRICDVPIDCGQLFDGQCSDCGRAYCPTCKAGFCADHGQPGKACVTCQGRLE